MAAYYNEFDQFAAEWLRELIKRGLIADGEVDTRSIEDVVPSDIIGFTQCHFFAGIGVWSHALRRAGWPDDRPVWTGSCPCQPFSAAGKGLGTKDERHLWPVFLKLIKARKPPVVFGEQVASRLVTGGYGGDGMQSLWKARQLLHFRKDWLEGNYPVNLQGMPEFGCEKVGEISTRQHSFASEQTGSCGQKEGSREGTSIRSGCRVGVGEIGSRVVPSERRAIRLDGDPGIFNPVAGQDRFKWRLHEGEHASNPVWTKRSPRNLGRKEVVRDGNQVDQDAIESINDLIAEISCELEEEGGESWINTLQLDLGRSGYTVGACVAPAAGFGAPHIRQRIYWVADSCGQGLPKRISDRGVSCREGGADAREAASLGSAPAVGLADTERHGGRADQQERRQEGRAFDGWDSSRLCGNGSASPTNGFWRDADWLFCRDGKFRPVEPGLKPLAHGAAHRMGCVCSQCKTEAVVYEGMYFLRKVSDWNEGREQKEVLQQRVLSFAQTINAFNKQEHSALSCQRDEGFSLRNLQQYNQPTGSPQRLESVERFTTELTDPMLKMPPQDSLQRAAFCVRRLWEGIQSGITQEQEQDMFCPVCQRMGAHVCTEEVVKNRVGRLRGYGNAIVAPQAEAFIRAAMKTINYTTQE